MNQPLMPELQPLLPLLLCARPDDLVCATEYAAVLLEQMQSADPLVVTPETLETLSTLRRLSMNAANTYQDWLAITAERTAGYDGCGAPAPLGIASVSVEG